MKTNLVFLIFVLHHLVAIEAYIYRLFLFDPLECGKGQSSDYLLPLNRGDEFLCVSTLITNNHVLTAATCFDSLNITESLSANEIKVKYNADDSIAVSKITIHPDFGRSRYALDADLAVIELAEPASFVNDSICLPSFITPVFDVEGTVESKIVDVYSTTATSVDPVSCRKQMKSFAGLLSERSFCAKTNEDYTLGSSFVKYENDAYTLLGIQSKDFVGTAEFQSFTNIPMYLHWINSQIASDQEESESIQYTHFDTPAYRDPILNKNILPLSSQVLADVSDEDYDAERDTYFLLLTKKNPTVPQKLTKDAAEIASSNWNSSVGTRFLIHGFLGHPKTDLNVKVPKALFENGNFNVIIVDWSIGANTLFYSNARYRVGDVGAAIAKFIDFLHENAFLKSFATLQLIGHSLGAHIAGHAGKAITRGKAQVIFGVDPAGPLFDAGNPSERLAATDAVFVQAIHSNPGVYGITEPIAQHDTYANIGSNQPGCFLSTCSHSRSVELFVESLSKNSTLIAKRCPDYGSIKKKACNGSTLVVGGHTGRDAKGIFYFPTSSTPWYGKGLF